MQNEEHIRYASSEMKHVKLFIMSSEILFQRKYEEVIHVLGFKKVVQKY